MLLRSGASASLEPNTVIDTTSQIKKPVIKIERETPEKLASPKLVFKDPTLKDNSAKLLKNSQAKRQNTAIKERGKSPAALDT